MASAVESVNNALLLIGHTSFVEDFVDPQNETERVANQIYESTRREVLSDFPWPFARVFAPLALLTNETPGWSYTYRYPTDCLMAKFVTDAGGYRLPAQVWFDQNAFNNVYLPIPRMSYEVQADSEDDGSKVIMTDVQDAYLWYVKDVSNMNQWTQLARTALEARLAMKFALGLKAEPNMFANASGMYQVALTKAQAHAFNEQRPDDIPQSPAIQARA